MPYLRTQAELGGCACRGCGTGALGDTVDPTQVRAIGAPAGTDPALYLRAHLNRYTSAAGAPIAFQIASAPLPLTTTIDSEVASRALFVLFRRAAAASMNYGDRASKALLATLGTAGANPVGYVTTNLPAVIDVVRLYGDANGLPAAKGVPQVGGGSLMGNPLVLAAGAVAAYFLLIKKRRR